MPPSESSAGAGRNAWVGCLWPIARNLLTLAAVFAAAGFMAFRTGDSNWFFGMLFGSIPILWLLDRTVFAARNRRERAAQKRFFGLEE